MAIWKKEGNKFRHINSLVKMRVMIFLMKPVLFVFFLLLALSCGKEEGLVLEKGKLRTWRMDMDKAQLPDYLRVFAEEVQKKIEILSD